MLRAGAAVCVEFVQGIELVSRSRSTLAGQKPMRRPSGLDDFSNAGDFMGTKIIHDNDVAWRQGRRESLLD
jgi:hypothetical protein